MLQDDKPALCDQSRRRWILRRWFVVPVLGLLLLVGSVAGLFYHRYGSAEKELRQAIAETDALEPMGWRLEDIEAGRAVVPDDQNSALVIMRAAPLIPKGWPEPPKDPPSDDSGDPRSQTGIPPSVVVFGNSLVPSIDRRVQELPSNFQLDELSTQELREELSKASLALAEARKLTHLPNGRYPITWGPDFLSTKLESQVARSVAALLEMEAYLQAQEGRIDDALNTVRGVFNCSRSVGDEPTLISQLIRTGVCDSIALPTLERVLAQGKPSNAALVTLQQLIEDEVTHPLPTTGLKGERAGQNRLFKHLLLEPQRVEGFLGDRDRLTFWEWRDPTALTVAIKRAHARFLREMNQLVEQSKASIGTYSELQRLAVQVEEELIQERKNSGKLEIRLLNGLFPAMRRVTEAAFRHRAKLLCANAALASERFRLAHGYWPKSFDELEQAKLLKSIPIDPFNGAPLRIKQTEFGLAIYSVGPDGKDNGGDVGNHYPCADIGFRLWNVDKRRAPGREWIPRPMDEKP